MRPAGYTLIELLVVITIITIIATLGFANYRRLADDQITTKAIGEIQTYLRLAQSNATSSTLCNDQGVLSWSLEFINGGQQIKLNCQPAEGSMVTYRTYTLENVSISAITGSNPACSAGPPFTVTYAVGLGMISVSNCSSSSSWTFRVENSKDATKFKQLILSRGGTIDAE